jgi:hypothetical protein
MIYNPEEFKERIIPYLNGMLSEKEREVFEETLHQNPQLAKEFREFSEIKEVYKEMEGEFSIPSSHLYHQILEHIKSEKKPIRPIVGIEYMEKTKDFFNWIFLSPRLSWGIVAVQLAVILFLLIGIPKDSGFKTLTSKPPLLREGIKINVVFDQETREKEIRELINRIGGSIVSGPSPEGLYIIEIKETKDIEKTMRELKESGITQFVEKVPF